MLIPRFSVRWLLLLMSACAVVAFVVSLAVAGQLWATALSAAIASLALTGLLYATVFCVAWGMSAAWRGVARRQTAASPFAMHSPPPQLLTPEEPD